MCKKLDGYSISTQAVRLYRKYYKAGEWTKALLQLERIDQAIIWMQSQLPDLKEDLFKRINPTLVTKDGNKEI